MSRPHVVSTAELSALRDLELHTRAIVEGVRQGLHRSPFHGYSAEFSQYRHYRPGDDLKYVDWKAFARTDRLFTRQFRETTNLAAWFVVDGSRSMDYGGPPTKFAVARSIAAVLGTLVLDQGDAAGLVAAGSPAYLPPRSGHHHLRMLLAALARLDPDGSQSAADGLQMVEALARRRGLVVAISDFYEDDAALLHVRRLARIGHDVILVHVLSHEEVELPLSGAVRFEDLETGRTLAAQADTVRADYLRAVGGWLARIERELRREGVDYVRVVVGDDIEAALRRFLVSRRGRG
jgi:uncharacterized protein (DUF58 family)